MPSLPPANSFTDPAVTEGGFRGAIGTLIAYLAGLLGSDGTPTAARAALGLGTAATRNEGAGGGLDADTLDGQQASAFASNAALAAHTARTDNPHRVSAAQVGAIVAINDITNPGGNLTIAAGANITVANDTAGRRITLAAATGEINSGANLGAGTPLYAGKSGANLQFKSLALGPNARAVGWTLSDNGQTVTLELTSAPSPSSSSDGGPA